MGHEGPHAVPQIDRTMFHVPLFFNPRLQCGGGPLRACGDRQEDIHAGVHVRNTVVPQLCAAYAAVGGLKNGERSGEASERAERGERSA